MAQSSREFVFIDARVSDVETLLGGLVPGARVHLLDPARDGLAQIAEGLRAAGASGLSAVSIVAHGVPGRLEIGRDALTEAGLPARAGALAVIADALAIQSTLRLFACDVARGPDGRRFVAALSAALGGRPVAAASEPLGEGAPWLLDHATAAPADRVAPFAADTLAAYAGRLASYTAQSTATFPAPQFSGRAATGDFDGDGDADIYYQTNGNGSAFQYAISNGNGTYTIDSKANSPFSDVTIPEVSSTVSYRVADFNGDGLDDIFVSTQNQDGAVYLSNAATGKFTEILTTGLSTVGPVGRTAFGDFDGDGKADIVYQTGLAGTPFRFGQGDGDGTFTDKAQADSPFSDITITELASGSSYQVADFNGDGIDDIILRANNADGEVYLSNRATGKYTKVETTGLTAPEFSGRAIAGDFDADGKADVLYQVGGADSDFRFGKGNGDGTFTDQVQADSPFAGDTIPEFGPITGSFYQAVDIDGDGDVDLRLVVPNAQGSYLMQDGAPPKLTGSTPVDNATSIAPGTDITLTFSETVVKGTGNIEIVRISDGVVVQTIAVSSGAVSVTGSTVTINPPSDLAGTTEYGLRIAKGAFADTGGAIFLGLTDPTARSFTTAAANTPPTAGDDSVTVGEDSGATIVDVLANDSSAPDTGETLTVTSVTQPANGGTVTLTGGVVRFTPDADFNGTTSFTYTISDGNGGTDTATANVTVTPVDDAPSLSPTNTLLDYTEGGAAVTLSSTLTLTDPDSATFTSATVVLLDPVAGDVLSGGSLGPLTGSYDAGTHTLTVSGPGTLAQLQAALRTVAFSSTSDDPTVGGTDNARIIDITAFNGGANGTSNTVAAYVDVTGVNDAPSLKAAAAVLDDGVENDPYTVTKTQLLQGWSDAETPAGSLTVTNVTSNQGGVVDNLNGTYTLTPTAGYDGLVTFSYTLGDGTATTPASLSVTLANLVEGTANADVLPSTAGPDAFRGLAGTDTVSYDGAPGAVTVSLLAPGSNTGAAAGDTYTSIENLRGSDFADTLSGNGSDNVIEGGDGGDAVTGNGGSDTASYEHSGAAVTVTVNAQSGNTGGDAEDDTLTGIRDLLGSAYDDTLTGDGQNNFLTGGRGADTMSGLSGKDRYVVDDAGDQVLEAVGGGIDDRVLARLSYTLADGQEVEVLATISNASTKAIDLTGNDKVQSVYGNAGANVLDGKAGYDVMYGLGGADSFAFSTTLAAGNVDRIADFVAADDTIELSQSVFSALGSGPLSSAAFKDLGAPGASVDADDRILYDYKGRLFYDADGAGGSDAVLFAKLSYRPTLAFDDVFVV